MTDYKLVPIGPTPEMVEAAESAYMPFGDMETAIRMAVLAAPAVQGEPVGEAVMLQMVEGMTAAFFYASHVPAGTPLYTAPQPAEQERFKRFNGQECWMWAGDGSDRLETLTCPVVITPADLMAIINRGSPAADVAGLVEALELAAKALALAGLEGEVTRRIDAALAAHRKQGGGA